MENSVIPDNRDMHAYLGLLNYYMYAGNMLYCNSQMLNLMFNIFLI